MDFYELLEEDQHNPEIQYQLGLCYLYGNGTEADHQEAMRWLQLAAEQGHGQAMNMLGQADEDRSLNRINDTNLPDWCANAEDGDVVAQYAVAEYFQRLDPVRYAADIDRYLTMAAEQGHGQACLLMGQRILTSDPEDAVRYLSNATESGIVEAMWKLAACFRFGLGTEQSIAQAEYWYQKAAENGDGEQKLALAIRHMYGLGVTKGAGKAMSWVYQASQQGIADARERLEQGQLDEDMQAWDALVQQEAIRRDAEYNYVPETEEDAVDEGKTAVSSEENAEEAPFRTVFDMDLTKRVQAQAKKKATNWAVFGFVLLLAELITLGMSPVLWYIIMFFDAFAYMPIATKLLEGFEFPQLLKYRLKVSTYVIPIYCLLCMFGGRFLAVLILVGHYFVSPYLCKKINSTMEDLSTIESMERFYNKHKGK